MLSPALRLQWSFDLSFPLRRLVENRRILKGWWGSEDRHRIPELRPRVQHDLRRPLSQDIFFVLLGGTIDVVSNSDYAVNHESWFISGHCSFVRTISAFGRLWRE